MTNIFSKTIKNIKLLILIVILVNIICQSKLVITATIDTLNLFINNLFAPIFIFYTLVDLLLNYNVLSLFNTKIVNHLNISSNALFILLFSLLSGFPSGSKYITDFYQKRQLDMNEVHMLLMTTHFSNPLFILGMVKNITNSTLAIIILISHYLSNFILLFIISSRHKKINDSKILYEKTDFTSCLNKSFKNTISILTIVLFSSIVFVIFSSLVCSKISNKLVRLFIFGLFDLTKGVNELGIISLSSFFKGLVITTFLSFGGINIHIQVKSIISKQKLPYSFFLIGRIIATSISLIIYILLFNILHT